MQVYWDCFSTEIYTTMSNPLSYWNISKYIKSDYKLKYMELYEVRYPTEIYSIISSLLFYWNFQVYECKEDIRPPYVLKYKFLLSYFGKYDLVCP